MCFACLACLETFDVGITLFNFSCCVLNFLGGREDVRSLVIPAGEVMFVWVLQVALRRHPWLEKTRVARTLFRPKPDK